MALPPHDLSQPRLVALDAFRGLTIAAMVIVNNPGTWSAMYAPLRHAPWHGWTPTDLIFPFFLFIVGVSITLSRQTRQGPIGTIVRRALVILALGLFLTGFPRFDLNQWRFTGVLQRIALCYLAAALVYRWTASTAPPATIFPRRQAGMLAAIAGAILVAYWGALTLWGDLTPEGNAGAAVDRAIFGSHLYRRGRWDPEGLVSSVPAVATTLLGVVAGLWLQGPAPLGAKVRTLAATGGALFVAGLAWGAWFPINKNLWTSSYVLLSGGAAAVVLAACLYAIDVRGWRRWSTPLVVMGMNAIAVFVVSGLVARSLNVWNLHGPLYQRGFAWMAEPKNASLLFSLAFLGAMYALCAWLYRRRWFLRA